MLLSRYRKWIKGLSQSSKSSRSGKRRKPIRRLDLEALECRLAPATHIWTGASGDGDWANAVNWNGGAPTGGLDADGKYADLVFGTLATLNHRATHDNLTVPSGGSLIFNSITFAAGAG